MAEDAVLLDVDELLGDPASTAPLWSRLAAGLAAAIADDRLPSGARLENEVSLAERSGLSRPTVRRAIQELVDRGLVVRRRGIGTQVVHGRVSRPVELTSLFDDLVRDGRRPRTTVLECGPSPAEPSVAEQLGVEPGAVVLRLRRLRWSEDLPLALLTNWLPPEHLPLDREALAGTGLYRLLRARGVAFRVARQRIGARRSTREESDLLQLAPHAAVLTVDRTAYDSTGRAVEHGHHCYRPDLHSFEMTLVDRSVPEG